MAIIDTMTEDTHATYATTSGKSQSPAEDTREELRDGVNESKYPGKLTLALITFCLCIVVLLEALVSRGKPRFNTF